MRDAAGSTNDRSNVHILVTGEQTVYSSVSDLPDQLLVYIFEALPIKDRVIVERVCRRWNNVAKYWSWSRTFAVSYWTIMDKPPNSPVHIPFTFSTGDLLSLLQRCGRYVTRFDFTALFPNIHPNDLNLFTQLCPNLRSLDVSGTYVNVEFIRNLGSDCPLLEDIGLISSLPLDNLLSQAPHNGITILKPLFQQCRRLKRIDFTMDEMYVFVASSDDDLYSYLADTIECLLLTDFMSTEDTFLKNAKLPNLSTLSLTASLDFQQSRIKNFPNSLRTVRKLRIAGFMDDPVQVFKTWTLLTELVLEGYEFSDDGIRPIVENCKAIRMLCLCYIYPQMNYKELAKLPCLKCLGLKECNGFDDVALQKIAERGILRVLSVCCFAGGRISLTGIASLLKNCKNLSCLDLTSCEADNEILDQLDEYMVDRHQNYLQYSLRDSDIQEDLKDNIVINLYEREEFEASRISTLYRLRGYLYKPPWYCVIPYENFCDRLARCQRQRDISSEPEGRNDEEPVHWLGLHVWLKFTDCTCPGEDANRLLVINKRSEHSGNYQDWGHESPRFLLSGCSATPPNFMFDE